MQPITVVKKRKNWNTVGRVRFSSLTLGSVNIKIPTGSDGLPIILDAQRQRPMPFAMREVLDEHVNPGMMVVLKAPLENLQRFDAERSWEPYPGW